LASKFRERFNGTTIVVSHHAPSIKSIPSALRNDLISSAYASDLEGLVSGSNAKLWIHGHIHSSSDYYLGKTRVICNPKGYPDEPVQDFDPKMVAEV
jgi:Icc-related predicted phosphoesterase